MSKIYTTKSGSNILGVKQDTLKHYALRFGIGTQPGGPGTPWIFTVDDLLAIRAELADISVARSMISVRRYEHIEAGEDRDALGMGPMYNPDASPRR